MLRKRILRAALRLGALVVCGLGLLAALEVADRLVHPPVAWRVLLPWDAPYVRLASTCDPACTGQVGLLLLAGHALALAGALTGLAGLLARRRRTLRLASFVFLAAMSVLVVEDVLMRASHPAYADMGALPEPQTLVGMLVLLPGVVLLAAYTYRDDAPPRRLRDAFRAWGRRLDALAEEA